MQQERKANYFHSVYNVKYILSITTRPYLIETNQASKALISGMAICCHTSPAKNVVMMRAFYSFNLLLVCKQQSIMYMVHHRIRPL